MQRALHPRESVEGNCTGRPPPGDAICKAEGKPAASSCSQTKFCTGEEGDQPASRRAGQASAQRTGADGTV